MHNQGMSVRYLELNGDRVGEPLWRSITLSWSFAAAVTGVCLTAVITNSDEKTKDATLSAVSGLIAMRVLRDAVLNKSAEISSSPVNYNTQCLDTFPTHSSNQTNDVTYHYGMHSLSFGLYTTSLCTAAAALSSTITSLSSSDGNIINLVGYANIAPPVGEALYAFYRSYMALTRKWLVVNKKDMEPELPHISPQPT